MSDPPGSGRWLEGDVAEGSIGARSSHLHARQELGRPGALVGCDCLEDLMGILTFLRIH